MPTLPPNPAPETPGRPDLRALEQLLEQLPVAVFAVDASHRIAMINDRTLRIAGMSRREIFREGCFGVFCDHKTHFEKCPGHASLLSGEPWDGEADIQGRHYRVSVRPLRLAGLPPWSLVLLDDRTEQHRHNHLLQRTIARLERLLVQSARVRECLTRLATIQDATEVRDLAIRAAAEMLGAFAACLVHAGPDGGETTVYRWYREPDLSRRFDAGDLRSAIAAHVRGKGELVYARGAGEPGDAELDDLLARAGGERLFVAPVRDAGGVWGRVGFLVDSPGRPSRDDVDLLRDAAALVEIAVRRGELIDEVARKEAGLVEAAAKAEAAVRARTMFLATMSHEIRTPLNAIIGFAEMLGRAGDLPPEVRECSDGISRSAGALLDLLNDILDLSKLEFGSGAGMMQGECDLPALFREMATVFRYSARAKGLELRPSIPADFPRLRLAGPRVRQILLNLIGNAVKFTERGFVEWTASAAPAGEGAVSLAIDVRDTGVGIPADSLEAVFDPFVQAGAVSPGMRTQKGTGLGLPIVRRLVEACGGTVVAESEPGKGSVFRIRIGRVATLAEPAPPPAEPAAPRGPAALPDPFLPLLVDDIDLNLEILALHLRALGVRETLRAASGEEALRTMRARRPSVVLTDLWMPGMDGAALARAVRADPAMRGVPVVAVTADNDAAASFDASVFDDILVKPLSTAKVADCLGRLFAPA